LERQSLEIDLHGLAMMFSKINEHTDNATWFTYGAGMQVLGLEAVGAQVRKSPSCSGNLLVGCKPKDRCKWSTRQLSCVPKSDWDPKRWWPVKDGHLERTVGGAPLTTGQRPLRELHGLRLTLHCGEKRAYGASGPPAQQGETLLACLKRGTQQNARLHARSPWKLFFPEEVVVVAAFQESIGRLCQPEEGIAHELQRKLCAEAAAVDSELASHVPGKRKSSAGGQYVGMHSGAGLPRGTPEEVVLMPEDILEAVDQLKPWKDPELRPAH